MDQWILMKNKMVWNCSTRSLVMLYNSACCFLARLNKSNRAMYRNRIIANSCDCVRGLGGVHDHVVSNWTITCFSNVLFVCGGNYVCIFILYIYQCCGRCPLLTYSTCSVSIFMCFMCSVFAIFYKYREIHNFPSS